MATDTYSSKEIHGIPYTSGQSFVCAKSDVRGDNDSEGHGANNAMALTYGGTYYFLGYAYPLDSSTKIVKPCRIGTSSSTSSAIGWYPESVFPYATYTIKYYANYSGGKNPDNQTKTWGTPLTLRGAMTRDGYTFNGWATSSTGSVAYAAGASYTNNSTANLYAKWTAKTCAVTLNSQPATTAGTTSVTATYDSAMLPITVPTKTGYTFGGYYTGTGGSGTQYYTSSGASARTWDKTADTTLYAKWTPITYTVKYDSNNGTGTMSDVVHTYDSEKALTANSFTRAGYKFTGWKNNSTGTLYTDEQSVKNLSSTSGATVTLHAQWEENILTVTYHSCFADFIRESDDKDLPEVSADVNMPLYSQKFKYATAYNDKEYTSEGLLNYSNESGGLYMKRTRYEATGYWCTTVAEGIKLEGDKTDVIAYDGGIAVGENRVYATGRDLAVALGLESEFDQGDVSIDLYAHWVLLTSYVTLYDSNGDKSANRGAIRFYVDNNINFVTSDSNTFKDANEDYFMTKDGSILHYGILTVYDSEGAPHVVI